MRNEGQSYDFGTRHVKLHTVSLFSCFKCERDQDAMFSIKFYLSQVGQNSETLSLRKISSIAVL